MDQRLPISALLSQTLVAFIVEFDNEFEHRVPHRTTEQASTAGLRGVPWLVSMVMWSRFLRYVDEDGITIAELQRRAGTNKKELALWLTRLSAWWGYLTVDPPATPTRVAANAVVRPTSGGRKAIKVWRTLEGEIEARWEARFGSSAVDGARDALAELARSMFSRLPDSLPILGYGLFSHGPDADALAGNAGGQAGQASLAGLLSQALLGFALEFERESVVSLAICANVLRFCGDAAAPARDLPALAGVSKESIAMALSFLKARGLAALEPQIAGSRIKVLRLSAKGTQAARHYEALVREIEARWAARAGQAPVAALRKSLEEIVAGAGGGPSPLLAGMEPYPDGWRAERPRPLHLPHFPMILHRGGFPDGS